ncbi:importin beta-2 subunit [Moniliophthora roreri MCA 2997]|uniref:Importin beta-2 subunit n=2 Tax=Moniliophthora roreri TaxID=221103 RepID=V2XWK0_MONRO|nr:importin beta-2 subunit [Moniliophthora roreri MCA 2997]KAI3611923.1 importin beta-2 subunit [Moniliophthora roreri]
MSQWSPQPAGLQEILSTIHESTDMSVTVQRNITQKLNSFTRVADYIAYLAYILCMSTEEDRIRTIAGYLLKNNARLILNSTPEVAHYVKASVLQAFQDPSVMIRNAAGQDVVAFLGVLEPRNWPECLSQLVNSLDATDIDLQEAAFNVLEKACEDYPRKLDVEIAGTRPLDFMIPKFLQLAEHPSPKMRSHAVACLSYFVPVNCQSLFVHIDAFIACLFKRASDEDPSVRRHVCQALVLLLAARPEKLMPEMSNVAEYMLYSTKDKNENVALEACEFWLTFAEDAELAQYLKPLLGRVAPVLLDCMVYGEDDLLWLEGDAEDSAVPDKETDIKPRFYGGKAHGLDHESNGDPNEQNRPRVGAYGEEQLDYDEDDDYLDDDEFVDEMSTEWNLRKCAAAALDVLAVRFSGDLLNVLLAPLKDKLWSSDWLQRESGILALGAMAEGCIEAIEPHLPTLVPYLINTLNDSKPLVRSITCWTLGRYASWTTQPISEEHKNKYFIPTMEGLLRMVLDNNKRVQEAGCSAFATLEEDAGPELVPYLEPVLRNLVFAFDKYQQKNMLILYDAVGTLADAVGRALSNPAYVEILMPPLTNRWSKLKDDDVDLIPLLECLASVTIAMGPSFLPYAGPVFDRCATIIHNSLLQYQAFQQNPDLEEPDKSFLVVALDLLSGLTQGLGMALEPFINNTNPPLLALLTVCLKHPQASVRQSAYALVGDMAMGCFTLLRPHMPAIMQELTLQLDPEPKVEFVSASNNAAWSVGEVALRYGRDDPEFQQWVNPLISRLIPILLHPKAPRSLHENAAVSIGRIGLMHPNIVAPHLPEFAQAWCQALYEIRDNEEKDSAFRGLCTMIQVNPAGIAKSLLWFCNSIVRWNQPSPELNNMFSTLLHGFKQHDEAGWAAQVSSFPPVIQERLAARYGV